MPSPVGHALAGIALGCLLSRRQMSAKSSATELRAPGDKLRADRELVAFAFLGVLPDIDFLFGIHSMHTHSIGAIAVIGLLVLASKGRWHIRNSLAGAFAYGSHVLIDWLGSDSTAPIGIMALWPFTSDFYLSEGYWFTSICRQYWLSSCWLHNGLAVFREILFLGSVAALCVWFRFFPHRTSAI